MSYVFMRARLFDQVHLRSGDYGRQAEKNVEAHGIGRTL